MSDRMIKINGLVKQQLGQILLSEMEWPQGVIVTITKVQTSRDLRYAKVFVSVLPEEKKREALGKIIRSAKELQRSLGGRVEFKNIPKLNFAIDNDEQEANEIDRLHDNLK